MRRGPPGAAAGGGGGPEWRPGAVCRRPVGGAPCEYGGGSEGRWGSPRAGAGCGLTGRPSLAGPGAAGAASRSFCAGGAPSLSYQELKDLKKASVLHIDVRERWEIDKFGKIPASVNIPRESGRWVLRCALMVTSAGEWRWQGTEELCEMAVTCCEAKPVLQRNRKEALQREPVCGWRINETFFFFFCISQWVN